MSSTTKKQLAAATTALLGVFAFQAPAAAEQKFQKLPGPAVITATFVGYLVAGFWGSLVSTIGIFFPSFILVLVADPTSGASQRQSQCPRLRKGCLWRRDRNDPGRLRPAWTNRHRRLANRSHRGGVAGGSVPLESEQSTAHSGDSRGGPHRIPAAAADMGDGQIGHPPYSRKRPMRSA